MQETIANFYKVRLKDPERTVSRTMHHMGYGSRRTVCALLLSTANKIKRL